MLPYHQNKRDSLCGMYDYNQMLCVPILETFAARKLLLSTDNENKVEMLKDDVLSKTW